MARQAKHRRPTADSTPDNVEHRAHAPISGAEAVLASAAGRVGDARWERLLDAITDPIGVVSADSRLIYANSAYRAMFNRVPDGVIGHECFSTHPNPSGGPCETCPVPAAIRTQRPAFVQSERPQRGTVSEGESGAESGERRIFQRWTYPMIAPNGSIDAVVEVIKDVTEQERLREASRQAEALRAADRLKAELLGTVSHELRSPLAAIKGYAGTLLRYDGRLPRGERHEFLGAISQASDRLEEIIDQLLLMSQLETGLITLQRAPVDLRQLAREAVIGIERRLPNDAQGTDALHHVVVVDHTRVPPDTIAGASADTWWAPVVAGDRRLLRQALDEILDNAVKYSPEGGLIEVTLDRLPPVEPGKPPMLALRVRDEGLGIPDEQLGHIFDRFHRLQSGLTSTVGGLGLGLTICKRVIGLHGGEVRVESEPGMGTVLTLLLPQDEHASQDDGPAASVRTEASADDNRAAPATRREDG